MIKIQPKILFQGESFSPKLAEDKLNIVFSEKLEVNEIATRGRYKDKPLPYGSSVIEPPDNVFWNDRISWLCDFLTDKIEIIKSCGATSIELSVAYYYVDQCNCYLTKEEISKIFRLQIPLSFSVYEVNDLETVK